MIGKLIWFVIVCCESVCLLNSGNCKQIKMKKQHAHITLEHMSNGLAALCIEVFVFASVQSLTFYFIFQMWFYLLVFLVLFFIKMEFDKLFEIFFLLLQILLYKMWFKIGRYNIDREKQNKNPSKILWIWGIICNVLFYLKSCIIEHGSCIYLNKK